MSIIVDYDLWEKAKLEFLEETNPIVKCPDCMGCGEVVCECWSQETSCSECDGDGELLFSEPFNYKPTLQEYYTECITDLKDYCAWSNKSFFEHVAAHIKYMNENHAYWHVRIR